MGIIDYHLILNYPNVSHIDGGAGLSAPAIKKNITINPMHMGFLLV